MNRKDDRRAVAARHRSFHGGVAGQAMKKGVQPAPAWNERNMPQGAPGSKILISNLPNDVGEEEVLDLMKKTVGPMDLRSSFMAYNSKGMPMGVAVVAFVRNGDAVKARKSYHGKVIDGKRAIKLELILDKDEIPRPEVFQSEKRSVVPLDKRIGPQMGASNGQPRAVTTKAIPTGPANRTGAKRPPVTLPPQNVQPITRTRVKKGPKRVKKTVADLDAEMEEYNARRRLNS